MFSPELARVDPVHSDFIVIVVVCVKCLCMLSRYLSSVVEICYMLNVVCVISLSQPSSRDLLYMLNVCVCYLVISVHHVYVFIFRMYKYSLVLIFANFAKMYTYTSKCIHNVYMYTYTPKCIHIRLNVYIYV